jgi:biopolymer transport protein ExbB/TolQ
MIAPADLTSSALSGISSGLNVPVHVVAILLLLALAFEVGRLANESWRRVRPGSPPLEQLATRAMTAPDDAQQLARLAPGPLSEQAVIDLAAATGVAATGADPVENALADYELRIQRRLDRTRMLVRAGPAIGLMGTLIPLAPGLSALGQGDYARLASDLKVAFAATVIGILVGTSAFALTLIRTRIYTEDLAGLERAVAARVGQVPVRVGAAVGEHSA